jgi:hypothetical protein
MRDGNVQTPGTGSQARPASKGAQLNLFGQGLPITLFATVSDWPAATGWLKNV